MENNLMTDDKKPREFWVWKSDRYTFAYTEDPCHQSPPTIHVIEYSAYQALEEKLKKETLELENACRQHAELWADYKELKFEFQEMSNGLDANKKIWLEDRDKLKAAETESKEWQEAALNFCKQKDILEQTNKELVEALEKIASCETVVNGDCPNIAREALK
jgi:hypothetical protein